MAEQRSAAESHRSHNVIAGGKSLAREEFEGEPFVAGGDALKMQAAVGVNLREV
ncbi:hypothetical protein [Croceibacterium ferulae]|uniref:hypothetical protein n=1 Tax=Croceibacterium ferulae TaxID=1854641 RepID=UPI0012D7CEC3|nr:hypothetical protein [Croceibacterium ferulae]